MEAASNEPNMRYVICRVKDRYNVSMIYVRSLDPTSFRLCWSELTPYSVSWRKYSDGRAWDIKDWRKRQEWRIRTVSLD